MAKICINAGHGESYKGYFDPGAVYEDLKECDITLNVAFKLKSLLESVGHEVIMTRTCDDMTKSLGIDVVIANNNNCDICIPIHVNATPSGDGIESWCMFGSNDSVRLCNSIQNNLIQVTGVNNRGVMDATNRYGQGKAIYMCRATNMPTVLTELMFIDNPSNYELLKQDSFLQRCAIGLFNGIQDYFGLKTINTIDIERDDEMIQIPDASNCIPFMGGWIEMITEQNRIIFHKNQYEYISIINNVDGNINVSIYGKEQNSIDAVWLLPLEKTCNCFDMFGGYVEMLMDRVIFHRNRYEYLSLTNDRANKITYVDLYDKNNSQRIVWGYL